MAGGRKPYVYVNCERLLKVQESNLLEEVRDLECGSVKMSWKGRSKRLTGGSPQRTVLALGLGLEWTKYKVPEAHLACRTEPVGWRLVPANRDRFALAERASFFVSGWVRWLAVHALLLDHTTFPCFRAAISCALKPNSASTSSVCSPTSGGRAAILLGVRDSVTGWPTRRI